MITLEQKSIRQNKPAKSDKEIEEGLKKRIGFDSTIKDITNFSKKQLEEFILLVYPYEELINKETITCNCYEQPLISGKNIICICFNSKKIIYDRLNDVEAGTENITIYIWIWDNLDIEIAEWNINSNHYDVKRLHVHNQYKVFKMFEELNILPI